MPVYPTGCTPPVDLANRIAVSYSRYGARLRALPDVTLAKYDCRDVGLVTPVKDQMQCGCCYDFAAVGCAEGAAILAGCGTADTINWSEQSALDCGDVGGCGGGWPETVLEYIKNSGIANTTDYPFMGRQGRTCKKVPHPNTVDGYGYVGDSESVPSVQAIKNALYEHGPLAIAVAADNAFMNYQPGTVFQDSGSTQIDHAIILVAWDDERQCWTIKNHWKTSWGNKGFMDIAYGANKVGFGAMFATKKSVVPKPSGIDWTTI